MALFVCPVTQPHHWYDAPHNISHAAVLMVAITGNWFRGLSEMTRNLITVGSVLITGFGIGLAMSNLYGLPSQVNAIETRALNNSQVISDHIVIDELAMEALKTDLGYHTHLAEWMACALAAHDDTTVTTLTACGVQPTRLSVQLFRFGAF